jgi:5-methylcytosine-specific restriction endonuclease McrA
MSGRRSPEAKKRRHQKEAQRYGNKARRGKSRQAQIARLIVRDGLNCSYCGIPTEEYNRTRDHVIPLSMGGTNTLDNLVLACKSCNGLKGNLTVEEFLGYLRGVQERRSELSGDV